MGIVNGLLGIRIVTPENRSDVQRGHILTRESIGVPRDLRHRNDGRRVIPFDARSLSVAPESHLRDRERKIVAAANILPAVPHTKVLTEAPVIAESPTLSEVPYTRYLRNDRT